MASLFKSRGVWVIAVHNRGRMRVGKQKSTAAIIHFHIQDLEDAVRFGVPPSGKTLDWVRNCDPKLRRRLEEMRLVGAHGKTVGELVEYFRQRNTGAKRSQDLRNYSMDNVVAFFGEDMALRDIRPQDAKAFKEWMLTKAKRVKKGMDPAGLAPATASRRLKFVRQMFGAAKSMDWIGSNPFAKLKPGKQTNPSRAYYVDADLFTKVADELPTAEFRLAFALMRWAGLRIGEVGELHWTGVDWSRLAIRFRTPKTEHLEGFEFRECPIFPELRPYLEAQLRVHKEMDVACCPSFAKWKDPRQQFDKVLRSAMARCGVKPWPRLFNNLRATRATEVEAEFGAKNESLWIGHGADTALKHYLIGNTESVWARATGRDSEKQTSKQEKATSEK